MLVRYVPYLINALVSVKRIIAAIILGIFISIYGVLKILDIDFLDVQPRYYKSVSFYLIAFSLTITILLLLLIEKKQDFFSIFNFMWLFPLTAFILWLFISPIEIAKLDFLFAKRIKEYHITKYKDGGWNVNRVEVGTDTFYFVQNTGYESLIDSKDIIVYKSRFKKYYHLIRR